MIATALRAAMAGDANRTIGLTGHPYLSMYVTNLGDRPGLLIDVELPDGSAIEDGQGFDIVAINRGARNRVLVRPTKPGVASPAFLGLVEFIFRDTAAANSRAGAIRALLDAVHEYRQFFARRAGRLRESAIRGLFAEVEFLLALVGAGFAPLDALESWSGPYHGTDFRFVGSAGIEIKSTRNPPRSVLISSEHQLVSPPGGLHLFVRPLTTVSPEDRGGISFLDLLDEAKSVLLTTPAAKALWDSAIDAIGLDSTDSYYKQWRFISDDWQAFEIREGFPKITPNLLSQLSRGIESVSYTLRLPDLAEFLEEPYTVISDLGSAYE